jgi:hypothetical protein
MSLTGQVMYDLKGTYWGTGGDTVLAYQTAQSPDALVLGLSADSNLMVICRNADVAFDFAHGTPSTAQTNPTFFFHDSSQSTTNWTSLSHGAIGTGAGNLALTPATSIATLAGNGIMTGASGARALYRVVRCRITGLADATQCTVEWTANVYNGETLAAENVDQDTPTGGTRFDISADGLTITCKGMTTTAVAGYAHSIHSNISGAAVYALHAHVVAGKLTLHAVNAATDADLDFTAIANTEYLECDITYITST